MPRYGGHAWVFLQYLLGFRRLGFDVMFIDRAGPDMGVTPAAADAFLRDVLAPFGLEGAHAVLCDGGHEVLGVGRDQLLSRGRDAAVFINVMGFVRDPAVLAAAPRPGFLA